MDRTRKHEEVDEKHGSADPALRGQRYSTPSTQSEAAGAFFINLPVS
jgi:hypothetical protein